MNNSEIPQPKSNLKFIIVGLLVLAAIACRLSYGMGYVNGRDAGIAEARNKMENN